ncbi:MAG: hypothetical protein GYA16_06030, partial [Spirochaetes bacterium]|nr:hypothetical protein [Spirochaetota bacterium]
MNSVIDTVTGLDVLHPVTVLVRIMCASIAGFCIGFERERHYQHAG